MKFIKILRYYLIELLYTGVMIYFMQYMNTTYSIETPMNNTLLTIILIGLIFIIFFIGPMLNRFFVFIYAGIYSLYLLSQHIYNKAFHQYYRFNTAKDLINEVLGVKESAFEFIAREDLIPVYILIGITVVFFILYLLLQRKCFKLVYRIPLKLATLLLFYPAQTQYNHYLELIEETKNSEDAFQLNKTDYYIYDTIPNTNQFVEKFGLLPFAYRDGELFLSNDVLSAEDYEEIDTFLAQRKDHQDNDMTSYFEGKDVIFIQAESFINAVASEELTPTIYKMQQESLRITRFNTPALPGSTSDTEFMANTSIIPNSEGHAVCYAYPDNYYETTLPGLFNDHGYVTYAFHNNYKDYYNRELTMKAFGYDHFLDCTELGLQDQSIDTQAMEVMKWIFTDEDKPYMAYWITFSGHQPYDLDSFAVAEEDVEKIKSLYPDLDDSYVSFVAKNMDLDRSMKSLIDALDGAGKLDNTVFVFFGDHIVKGLDYDINSTYYPSTNQEWSREKMYTDMYIYCTDKQAMTYDKVSTSLDILPTIANLWGFEYDAKTILGNDIFDPEYHGFYFSEWEFWRTDDYAYDFMYDTFYEYGDYDLDKAQKEMDYAMHEKEVAKKILKLDYFRTKDNH